MTPGGKDEEVDANITQQDYNETLSKAKHDPIYVSFLTRLQKGGAQQVLRYSTSSLHREEQKSEQVNPEDRDRGRIFVSKKEKDNASTLVVPPCQFCGAARCLEFQVMPQLLYYLKTENETVLTKTIDPNSVNQTPDEINLKGVISNKNNTVSTCLSLTLHYRLIIPFPLIFRTLIGAPSMSTPAPLAAHQPSMPPRDTSRKLLSSRPFPPNSSKRVVTLPR